MQNEQAQAKGVRSGAITEAEMKWLTPRPGITLEVQVRPDKINNRSMKVTNPFMVTVIGECRIESELIRLARVSFKRMWSYSSFRPISLPPADASEELMVVTSYKGLNYDC
jgi:hypothetical protein